VSNLTVSRRAFVAGFTAVAARPRLFAAPVHGDEGHVLFGTAGKVSKGIYGASFRFSTGELGPISLVTELSSPTFLAQHASSRGHYIYAVSETDDGGKVSAFLLTNPTTLQLLNDQLSQGGGPTHLSVSADGRSLALANYGGGSTTSYHLEENGSLSTAVSHFQYAGTGPNHDRQEKPHAHSAQFSPDGRFLLVNDLGLDCIHVYHVDPATAKLTPADPPEWRSRAGVGPRHIVFHPNGRWLYSVNELDSTVDLLHWDKRNGRITASSHVSTLKEGFPPNTAFAGEIAISADGKFVYVGNRIAENSIAVLNVNPEDGTLKLQQLADNGGKVTRHLVIDPTGRWMLLSNQGSGAIVVLARDPATGRLSEPKHTYPLDTAMFAMFVA
jgi:6-phosphogluconolactonase